MLKLEDVGVHYGPVQALRGVTLHVEDGEMVALLGANGAGKTTTLRAISGLIPCSSGRIEVDGIEVHRLAGHKVIGTGIAHLPQGRELFPELSVLENLRLGHWVLRSDRSHLQERTDYVLELFPRLRERAKQAAGTMSGGEQQMLAVGRALMSGPKLLLVDEASMGLAPIIVEQLFDVLGAVNQAGTAVLVVEQFVGLALKHTQRAYVLAKGEVVLEGPSVELVSDPQLVEAYLGGFEAAS